MTAQPLNDILMEIKLGKPFVPNEDAKVLAARIEALETKVGQAYQAFGTIEPMSEEESKNLVKALDYFGGADFDPEFKWDINDG